VRKFGKMDISKIGKFVIGAEKFLRENNLETSERGYSKRGYI